MLQFSELKKRNLLSCETMINIRGGQASGTCGYETADGDFRCDVSKRVALDNVADGGGHWCCDSCWQSTYCATRIIADGPH